MSKEEFLAAISDYFGMVVRESKDKRDILEVVSPNGVVILELVIGCDKDGWYYGGYNGLQHTHHKALCRINDPLQRLSDAS